MPKNKLDLQANPKITRKNQMFVENLALPSRTNEIIISITVDEEGILSYLTKDSNNRFLRRKLNKNSDPKDIELILNLIRRSELAKEVQKLITERFNEGEKFSFEGTDKEKKYIKILNDGRLEITDQDKMKYGLKNFKLESLKKFSVILKDFPAREGFEEAEEVDVDFELSRREMLEFMLGELDKSLEFTKEFDSKGKKSIKFAQDINQIKIIPNREENLIEETKEEVALLEKAPKGYKTVCSGKENEFSELDFVGYNMDESSDGQNLDESFYGMLSWKSSDLEGEKPKKEPKRVLGEICVVTKKNSQNIANNQISKNTSEEFVLDNDCAVNDENRRPSSSFSNGSLVFTLNGKTREIAC